VSSSVAAAEPLAQTFTDPQTGALLGGVTRTGALVGVTVPGTMPQAQSFALANNTYRTLQSWVISGQTDDPLPAFGLVAGSQTYGSSPPVQGPAYWQGFNPTFLSGQANPASPHGAIGVSCFGDAGDTNNGSGGHGLEYNVAFACGTGGKATNGFQLVALDDATNTANLTLRCGTGTSNGITSNIVFQNADASTTFMTMSNATSSVGFSVPVGVTNATLTIANASAQATLAIGGSPASGLNCAVTMGTSSTVHWRIQDSLTDGNFFEVADVVHNRVQLYLIPSAAINTAQCWINSQAVVFDSLVVSSGVVLTNAATHGFFYYPQVSGAPTGTPESKVGASAACYDTTNHKIWVYDGGWKGVVVS
jgi:hypothetical protein